MAGKSGRNISNVPEKSLKKNILSWEGMLVVVFVLIVIFCRSISPNFHVTNVLREMPKYLAEGFIMLAMAYVLILGEIDISVGAIVCLSSTWTCMVCNKGLPFGAVVLVCLSRNSMWTDQWTGSYKVYRITTNDRYTGNTDHLPRYRRDFAWKRRINLSDRD